MRSIVSVLYAASALTGSTSAFHAPLSFSTSTRQCAPASSSSQLQMAAATDEIFQRNVLTPTHDGEPSHLPLMSAEEWNTHIQTSSEIDHIRKELIGRYARNGFDRSYAKEQVEEFLLDPEQSLPFLEMRRFAQDSKSSFDDGLTGDLTLVMATAVMLLGTVGVHMLSMYSDYLVNAGHA